MYKELEKRLLDAMERLAYNQAVGETSRFGEGKIAAYFYVVSELNGGVFEFTDEYPYTAHYLMNTRLEPKLEWVMED